MKTLQRGFTLIELVMVIVILGILAAVALPKFVNLQTDAQLAAVQGVAGALSSGSSINYATYVLHGTTGTPAAVAVTSCDSVKGTLQGGAYPSGNGGAYSSLVSGTFSSTAGAANSCILTFAPTAGASVTASFTAIAAP